MIRQTPCIIFTDLDGTLLDRDSFSYRGAEPALERLQAHKVPVVFCTSQTRAEVEALRAELKNRDPFIVENGGAVFIPAGYFPFPIPAWKGDGDYRVIELGVCYEEVVAVLRRASELSGCEIRAFHGMSAAQVARHCRMSLRGAELAKQREYDEPFEILSERPSVIASLFEHIEEEGLTWTRDNRFYHVRGRHNKGQAIKVLIAFYRRWWPELITVGLGSGPSDISLLEAVDVPIVIPSREKAAGSPAAHGAGGSVAEYPGPRGWNQAVLHLLEGPGALAAAAGL
jgi:mannosyl-3-phosphoglycerate phosphatase